MADSDLYEHVNDEAFAKYSEKTYPFDELLFVKDFLDDIYDNNITNKKDALIKFKKLKEKITDEDLESKIINELEKLLFRHDQNESKYEESIAGRVKVRQQNLQPIKYDEDGYDSRGFDKWMYDHNGCNSSGVDNFGYYMSGYNNKGYDREGYDKMGYNKDGFNRYGINENGLIKMDSLGLYLKDPDMMTKDLIDMDTIKIV